MWSVVRRTVTKGSPVRTFLRCLTVESTTETEKKREITMAEAKKLMKLVNVDEMKQKLVSIANNDSVARSLDEAHAYARVLEDAGVILIFRDQVYLRPDKVVDMIRKAMPFGLDPEDEKIKEEFEKLRSMKEEIDVLAHKQVRKILWCGLGYSVVQIGFFVRLTFWEFSWEVMEPITFFFTASGIVVGYGYFLLTSRDPTYQDLMTRLFLSRQRKLLKSRDFDVERFKELERKWYLASCSSPSTHSSSHANASIRNHVGVHLDLEDSLESHPKD